MMGVETVESDFDLINKNKTCQKDRLKVEQKSLFSQSSFL